MRMQEIDFDGQPPIDSFGAGGFRVDGVFREGNMLLGPGGASDWPARRDGLSVVDFAPVLEGPKVDVLLVGMGPEIAPLSADIRKAFDEAGIGIEAMSTSSACRTYNVLLAEDRRVAVALIAV